MTHWKYRIEGCGAGLYIATATSTCGRFTLQAQGPTRVSAGARLREQVSLWRRQIDGIEPS